MKIYPFILDFEGKYNYNIIVGGLDMPDCKCIICNTTFYSKRLSRICDSCRIRTCTVCGNSFKIDPSCLTKTTCSKACKEKLTADIRQGNTATGEVKICKYCGKEFISNHNRRDYCYADHYKTCEVCGKEFKILHMDSIPKTCSRKCATIAMANTNLDNLGVKSNFQTQQFKELCAERCKKLHGVEFWPQADEVRKKISTRVSQARSNFGEEIKAKWVSSLVQRTGVPSPRFTDKSKYENYRQFTSGPKTYLESLNKPTIQELENLLGVNNTTILNIIHNNKLEALVSWKQWSLESEVIDFLKSVKPDVEIIQHDRTVISPQEIDIYLPEYEFGIECNPTCTHNSTRPDPWGGSKSNKYHQSKSLTAESNEIQLFHIFGYEWSASSDILKSMIASKLGLNSKIYARECSVVELCSRDTKQFLNDNHRQGYTPAKISIGLIYQDRLIACMTFGKPRKVLTNDTADYELIRFCNAKGITVVGGASKLFKYFIQKYEPVQVISYSDIARTSGKLYDKLGFKLERVTDPNYIWVNLKDDSYLTRYQTQKHKLLEQYPDVTSDETEVSIMTAKGYVQVFDSGNKVWRWHK